MDEEVRPSSLHVCDLPPEVLLHIFSYLPTEALLLSASLTCSHWRQLVAVETAVGRLVTSIRLDPSIEVEEVQHILQTFRGASDVILEGYDSCSCDIPVLLQHMEKYLPKLSSLNFQDCDLRRADLGPWLEKLRAVRIGDNCALSCQLWEQLSHVQNLKSMKAECVPTGFIPLILTNKPFITELELGELSNQMVFCICYNFQSTLKSLAFYGTMLTYSGVASLFQVRNTLTELRIRDPKYLTKYSLKTMAKLSGLRTLALYWLGRHLITNPWCFEYNLDRIEQRIEPLFDSCDGDRLTHITRLDLSGFYQTVDDKLVQVMCENQLSSRSDVVQHLRRVSLAHCYQITDAGAQWLVGSKHSIHMESLNLASTDITGQCFLRKIPHLTRLDLSCCLSVGRVGLTSMAMSCPVLKELSLAKCKQLIDSDFLDAFKHFCRLEILDLSYTNVSGRCFSVYRQGGSGLRHLKMACCPKLHDQSLTDILKMCQNLKFLDLSGCSITGKAFRYLTLVSLRTLYLDFCTKLELQTVSDNFPVNMPNVRNISLYGNTHIGFNMEWKAIAQQKFGNLKFLRVTSIYATLDEVRNYARRRGLQCNDWFGYKHPQHGQDGNNTISSNSGSVVMTDLLAINDQP